MQQAVVIDSDVLGRNLVRGALERLGFVVRTAATVIDGEQLLAATPVDLLSIDAAQSGDSAMNLARRLRSRGWRGLLVHTATAVSDERLRELTRDLGACAVFHKPMALEEVQLRLANVVPPDLDPRLVEEALLPASWNGALRKARKDYGKNLTVWVQNLVHELSEARRTGDKARIAEALRLVSQVKQDAARFLFQGIAELAEAMEALTQEMAGGRVPAGATARSWDDIDALLEVLSLSVPSAERSLATVNTAQVEHFERAIMVVTPHVDSLIEAAQAAEKHKVGMLSARNLKEALRVALRRNLDGAILAHDLPDGGVALLVEWLQRQPGLSDLPVALLVPPGGASDPEMTATARARGARFVVESPLSERRFLGAVERLTKARPQRRPKILCLDADKASAIALKNLLEAHRIELAWASSASDLRNLLESQRPDLLMVDVMLPVAGGFDVCRQVRALSRWSTLPVLFTAGQVTAKVKAACFRAGGDDCVAKPFAEDELIPRLSALFERFRTIRDLDTVTGLLHRRAFLVGLRDLLTSGEEVALGLVDVEHFSQINKLAGYEMGDRSLGALAVSVGEVLADRGIAGRWGDDQIVLAISGETRTGMQNLLMLLQQKVKVLKIEGPEGRRVQLSVAFSATSTSRVGRTAEGLLADAEATLVASKAQRG